MPRKFTIACFTAVLLVAVVALVRLPRSYEHDPKDLPYWVRAAGAKDWSVEANRGQPEAEFYLGLTLLRSNLVTMTERVPELCAIPIIGKRFFEHTSYGISSTIGQERLVEAHRWIKKAADQGYAPAQAAERMFIGALGGPTKGSAVTGRPPVRPRAQQTPAATDSRRAPGP